MNPNLSDPGQVDLEIEVFSFKILPQKFFAFFCNAGEQGISH